MVKLRSTKISEPISDKIFGAACVCISTIFVLMVLYPLIYIVSASVSDPHLVNSGAVWLWPRGLNIDGYLRIFQTRNLMIGYANTIFYTVFGTLINLILTLPCAYAISKKSLPGRVYIMIFLMIPMYFSGGLIPTYLWIIRGLNLGDTRILLLIIGAVSIFNLMIARSFFLGFPSDLEEAGIIDGCSTTRMFVIIVLPLSKALISVLMLYYAVGHWNSWFAAMIYLNDESKMPLQLFLRRILINNEMIGVEIDDPERLQRAAELATLLRFSVIIVSSLPVLILYPFIQKYFDKGVMLGSLKG